MQELFFKGDKLPPGYRQFFTGNVWINMLVPISTEWNCPIGYVTFDKGARNNWHKHPGGQILLVISGEGWYQEEGKEAVELLPGMTITIPKGIKHWHGAKQNETMSHLSIETNISLGAVEWLEPVNDDQYNKLK